MRNAFIAAITAAAAADPRLVLLVADNGAIVFDDFRRRFPGRFINVGICEQAAVGIAAWMALAGARPVIYTIIPFLTARAAEQIRVDVALQRMPVLMVGIGAGIAYSTLGPTHHAIEDVAWMRTLPGLSVVCPSDPEETGQACTALLHAGIPAYLRLGLNGEPQVLPPGSSFTLNRGRVLQRGSRVALLACGTAAPRTLQAAALLSRRGCTPTVALMPTVKPLDTGLLTELTSAHSLLVSIEDHGRDGGFGGAVAEFLAERETSARLLRLGFADRWTMAAGTPEELLSQHGLLPAQIAETVSSAL